MCVCVCVCVCVNVYICHDLLSFHVERTVFHVLQNILSHLCHEVTA
jgi:hypothetical protein